MKLLLRLILLMPLWVSAALAASQSQIPPKFQIPWGNSAGSAYIRSIPTPSQIGTQNCAASLTDGFVPLTFIPAAGGGCPPFGQDFNGIFNQITQWSRWQAAGGPILYDSAFQASIGGYPKGATVGSITTPGLAWISTADNNTTNPDTGGANWANAAAIGIGNLGGALSGTLPNPTLAAGAASANIGTLSGGLTGSLPSPGLSSAAAIAAIGSLGGSLAGTLPNPSIATNASLPGSPTTSTQATGDSSTKVATTAFTNPGSVIAANGYQKLPSGLILQWGSFVTSGGASVTVTFPTPFLHGPLAAFANEASASGWSTSPAISGVANTSFSATQMSVYTLHWTGSAWSTTGSYGVFWYAIGW